MPKNRSVTPDPASLSFEDALERLENVVEQMQSGESPLEKIIEQYEEGSRLLAHCEAKLKSAAQKIELLTRDKSGNVVSSALEAGDMEESPEDSGDQKDDGEVRLL